MDYEMDHSLPPVDDCPPTMLDTAFPPDSGDRVIAQLDIIIADLKAILAVMERRW